MQQRRVVNAGGWFIFNEMGKFLACRVTRVRNCFRRREKLYIRLEGPFQNVYKIDNSACQSNTDCQNFEEKGLGPTEQKKEMGILALLLS